MKIEHFALRTDDNKNEFITFAEGITKTRQSGLHVVHRVAIPKMFATNTERCPVNFFKLYLSKRPVDLRSTGPLYLAVNHRPATNIWYKSSRMGEHTIDNLMKRMVANSPLNDETSAVPGSTKKKFTNHSARKTLVKKLKKNKYSKSEIITITGHTNEKGLDAYDSGDEDQQRQLSHAIDNVQSVPPTAQVPNIINNNHTSLATMNPTFNLIDSKILSPVRSPAAFNFHNCTVNLFNQCPQTTSAPKSPPRKRRKYVIYSSPESSQE